MGHHPSAPGVAPQGPHIPPPGPPPQDMSDDQDDGDKGDKSKGSGGRTRGGRNPAMGTDEWARQRKDNHVRRSLRS